MSGSAAGLKNSPWKTGGMAYLLLGLALAVGVFIGSWEPGLTVAVYVWIGLVVSACLLAEFVSRTPAAVQSSKSRRVIRVILIGGLALIGVLGLLLLLWLVIFTRGLAAFGKIHM